MTVKNNSQIAKESFYPKCLSMSRINILSSLPIFDIFGYVGEFDFIDSAPSTVLGS